MSEATTQVLVVERLHTRLRASLVWGWVLFSVTLVGVPVLWLSALFTADDVRKSALGYLSIAILALELLMPIFFLVFIARSLRVHREQIEITRLTRRLRVSSILQLVLVFGVPLLLLLFVVVKDYLPLIFRG